MSTIYSCVVDGAGPYPYQATLLVRSLIELAGVAPGEIVAHIVTGADPAVARELGRHGVATRSVAPFGHPYCNKLQQLRHLAERPADRTILLDTDIFALRPLDLPASDAIQGKIVDVALPPLRVIRGIAAEAGLEIPPARTDLRGEETVAGNFNGGLYVIPGPLLAPLADGWERWARWCLERLPLFESWTAHVDQIAFAFAVRELGLPIAPLGRAWNMPTHQGPADVEEPVRLLHYHRHVDEDLELRPTGGPGVDAEIARANEAIRRWRLENGTGPLFRQAREATEGRARSGGRDGAGRERLRATLRHVIRHLEVRSVVAVGAADPEILREIDAEVAITVADRVGDEPAVSGIIVSPAPLADLAVCLDHLPHLVDPESYRSAVAKTVASGRTASLLSGFDAPPPGGPGSRRFHEPLIETIRRLPGVAAIPLAMDGDAVVYLVMADREDDHPRQIGAATLTRAVALGRADPGLLLECLATSRRELGFFPDHAPRCIEYPWVLERVRRSGERLRVADVGAGVNVLPLLLADDGHSVTTIDPHPDRRELADRDTWNEWGFLDYGQLRPGITSVRERFETYAPGAALDAIYSVSVIEHLPAGVRRAWVGRMSELLKPGGRLLLTVDLVPFTRALWRWSEDAEVEPAAAHGTIDDLVAELAAAGLVVDELEVIPFLEGSRVGIACIAATRALGAAALAPTLRARMPAGDLRRSRPPVREDTVTVLVPAYRPTERFSGLLRSMAAQTHPRVIVRVSLDHAPGAGLPEIPPMGRTELEIVEQPERRGWVGNVNRLFATVTTPYFVFISHDDQLTPTYIAEAVAALEAAPDAVSAHGGVRFHGIHDGAQMTGGSIRGTRLERVRTALERGPHIAGLHQRGVFRSAPLHAGVHLRTGRSDGQFSNDLWALEMLLFGETIAIDGIWYDKYTDPGGLSRVFHARTTDEKSQMLADNLGCLVTMLRERALPVEDQEWIVSGYAAWLLGLQGNWNVVADEPNSDALPYREVRAALARFIARSHLSAAHAEQEPPPGR